MKTHTSLLALIFFLAAPLVSLAGDAVHLILLSGQSNMANLDPDKVFTPEIEKHFGAGNVVVVVSPTCSPCRSALMSGRHEFKNGVTHTILERERMSLKTHALAQMLKSVGYTTGIFGKWHLGDEEAYRPENRGFDEVYIHSGGGIGQTYPGSCGDAPGNTNIDPALWHNGKFEKTKGYCTDLFFGQAIKWMDAARTGKQPFFAYIPLNAAHGPHLVLEDYYKQYLGNPGVSKGTAKFFGMIENIDTNFGVLLKKLGEWGIEKNTLVIFITGDNGGTAGTKIFNGGLRGSKGSQYQGGTRATAFFRWPGGSVPTGAECDALTAHLDILPTLAELTGARLSDEVKRQVEGRSLLPLLKNPKAEVTDRILVHHVGRWRKGGVEKSKFSKCAIQNSRFTLVNNTELYDLKADPGEKTNVIAAHSDVVANLRTAYDAWWSDVQPLLVNENAVGPRVNPMKELYWKQFGGGPDARLLERMNPNENAAEESDDQPAKKKRQANALTGEPRISTLGDADNTDGCTNEVRDWTDAKSGRRVKLVKVIGGGHVVPGGAQYLPKFSIGPACRDFKHAEVMWEFFKTAARP